MQSNLAYEDALRRVLAVCRRILDPEHRHPPLKASDNILDWGLDSLGTVEYTSALGQEFGCEVPPTLLFDCTNMAAAARFFCSPEAVAAAAANRAIAAQLHRQHSSLGMLLAARVPRAPFTQLIGEAPLEDAALRQDGPIERFKKRWRQK